MKPKMMLKLGVDLAMTILLLCQMAYMLISETAHEWMGVLMFVLFVLHHLLNRSWHKSLTKGRYTAVRTLQTVVDVLVLLSMISLMVSGIVLSREVFDFLHIRRGMGFFRILHMLAAYWGFILMSFHLGLHWGMVMGAVRKMSGVAKPSLARTWTLRGAAILICGYGIYAFLKNNIADYLFVRSRFVFFDFEQPLALFFAEYLAMMGLWVCIAYYLVKALNKLAVMSNKTKQKTK